MSAQADAPLRRDAAANRERLLVAALEVFNDQGIDAGVEHIAQRAGVGVGTLYRRFPTKDALIEHLVAELLADMLADSEAARAVPNGHGLEQYVRRLADRLAAHRGCLTRLWGLGASPRLDDLRARHALLLQDAQAAGTIRPEIQPSDLTVLVWSLRGVVEASGAAAEAACQRHLDIAFAGLRPQAAELPHPALTLSQLPG